MKNCQVHLNLALQLKQSFTPNSWRAVLATWDIRSQTRRSHQPDFPFLSLYPYKMEGTAWRTEHSSFRLKSSRYEKASRTRQKSGIFVSFVIVHTRQGTEKTRRPCHYHSALSKLSHVSATEFAFQRLCNLSIVMV
jgi:hypothetical protein